MKKIILTFAAVIAFGAANAQTKKETAKGGEGFANGDAFVSGALTLSSTNNKNTDVKTSTFEINPQVGFFVTDNIAVGAQVGYKSEQGKTSGTKTQDDSTLSLGAFGRYYFTPASKFSLFGQLDFGYQSMTDNLSSPKYKVNGFGGGLGAGANYFLSSHFSIEAAVGVLQFASAKANTTGAKNVSVFQFGGDWRAVSFGVNYKF